MWGVRAGFSIVLVQGRRSGAFARGRSREAEGGGPPRVLRDYCRKTLTPQPLAESPPTLPAPPAPLNSGVYNLNSALFRCDTSLGCWNGCTNDRFQPRIWAIIDSRFSKPAGYGDFSCVEPAFIGVKSVVHARRAGFTRGRWWRGDLEGAYGYLQSLRDCVPWHATGVRSFS